MSRPALKHLPIGDIRPGRNVRIDLTDIDDLADSLRMHGMLQPITVVLTEDGAHVEVLFGHRRFEAAKRAKFTEVPCFVRVRGTEKVRLLTQLAENFDRQEMTVLDEAYAFRELVAHGMSQQDIASMIHRSQAHVSFRMTLLKYPACIQQAVHAGTVTLLDALAVPREICTSTREVSLAKALEKGKPGLKRWVERMIATDTQRRGPVPQKYRKMRHVDLEESVYDLARSAALKAHLTVPAWVAQLITTASTRGKR